MLLAREQAFILAFTEDLATLLVLVKHAVSLPSLTTVLSAEMWKLLQFDKLNSLPLDLLTLYINILVPFDSKAQSLFTCFQTSLRPHSASPLSD